MAIGEAEAGPARSGGGRRRLRLTVLGTLGLVALIALGLAAYRRYFAPTRPTLVAVYRSSSPVADGSIGRDE
jgi:hypothetical protein